MSLQAQGEVLWTWSPIQEEFGGLLVMDLRVVYGFNQNILISDTPWYSSLVQALFSSFMFTNDNTITKFWEEHFLITGSPLQMRQLALGSSENTFHPPASELPTKATVTMLLSHTQPACILKMPWEVKWPPSNTHSILHGVLLCCYTRHQQQRTHVPNCGSKAKWLKNQKHGGLNISHPSCVKLSETCFFIHNTFWSLVHSWWFVFLL